MLPGRFLLDDPGQDQRRSSEATGHGGGDRDDAAVPEEGGGLAGDRLVLPGVPETHSGRSEQTAAPCAGRELPDMMSAFF